MRVSRTITLTGVRTTAAPRNTHSDCVTTILARDARSPVGVAPEVDRLLAEFPSRGGAALPVVAGPFMFTEHE